MSQKATKIQSDSSSEEGKGAVGGRGGPSNQKMENSKSDGLDDAAAAKFAAQVEVAMSSISKSRNAQIDRLRDSSSFRNSLDLSLSSIINDFSKKLDGNTSSSFLMHVDDKSKTLVPEPEYDSIDVEMARRLEVLRRMSGLDIQCSRDILREVYANSFINSLGLGANVEEVAGDIDSWDAFDKAMENSMPAKDWELMEFDIAQQSTTSLPVADQEVFISGEEAQREIDKEEEFRDQFLQSDDATFVPQSVSSSLLQDPLSMTNYFQARSSFPVDNCANDSTMLGERHEEQAEDVLSETEKTLFGLDPRTVSNSRSLFEELSRINRLKGPPSELNESTPTAVQKFLTSSSSDGAPHEAITDFIIEACKASAARNAGSAASNKNQDLTMPVSGNTDPTVSKGKSKPPSNLKDYLSCKGGSGRFNSTLLAGPVRNTAKVTFLEPSRDKAANVAIPSKLPISKMGKAIINGDKHYRKQKQRVHFVTTAQVPIVQFQEAEKSIVITESGKATFFDEKDSDFDTFERNLRMPHSSKGPSQIKGIVKNSESTVDVRSLKQNNGDLNLLISRKEPASAFAAHVATGRKSEKENVHRRSVELLRKNAVVMSPPQKLKLPSLQSQDDDQEKPNTRNHSTPIASEPISTHFQSKERADFLSIVTAECAKMFDKKKDSGFGSYVPYTSNGPSQNQIVKNSESIVPEKSLQQSNKDLPMARREPAFAAAPVVTGGQPEKEYFQRRSAELHTVNEEIMKPPKKQRSKCGCSSKTSPPPLPTQSNNPTPISSEQTSIRAQTFPQPPSGFCPPPPSGYSFPVSIHIHLPAFAPGMYPCPPQYGNHTEASYGTQNATGLPSTYSQHK